MVTDLERNEDFERWWDIHDKGDYVCPDCGRDSSHPEFRRWEVHHINAEAHNCVALCQTCHKVRHGADRKSISLEAWKQEFLAMGD